MTESELIVMTMKAFGLWCCVLNSYQIHIRSNSVCDVTRGTGNPRMRYQHPTLPWEQPPCFCLHLNMHV